MNRFAPAVIVAVLAVAAAVLLFIALNQEPVAGQPSPSPEASASGAASEAVTPTPDPELLSERLTLLVVGLDSSDVREDQGQGVNTDTLMLVSIGPQQQEVDLISVPRDMVDIPMPDGSTWERKVNAIYAVRGIDTLVGAMEELFAVPIDGYAVIDMDDLVALVDAVGGVTVNPEEPLVDPIVNLDMPAGEQHIDGQTALAYVRTRIDTDYGRAARQQEVVLELARALVDPATELDVRSLLSGLESFETNLPLDDLASLMEIARRARDADVNRQVLRPPEFITFEGNAGDGRGYILMPDIEAIRAYAAERIGESAAP